MALEVKKSAYGGEVLQRLLVRATTFNELVAGGHIMIQPNVHSRFTIPTMKIGKMLQKYKPMPDYKEDAQGKFEYDEVYLRPKKVMAFTTFDPATFEHIWRPFQPTGNLVFQKLPAHVQNQMLDEMAKSVDMELGDHFINGKYTDAKGDFFNGILTRILMNSEVVKIADPVEIIEKNVLDVLRKVKAAIPKGAKKNKKNLKIFLSDEDFELYDWVITEKPYKGVDYTQMTQKAFKGIPIVALCDWPKNVVVATYASADLLSNFWAAVSLANDANVIQIDKVNNYGDLYFFKMLMKIDTNVVFGEDIVLYDPRKDVVLPGADDEDPDDEEGENPEGGEGGEDPDPDAQP
jgi:hypothetical protein